MAKTTMPALSPAQSFDQSLAEMARDPTIDASKLETLLRVRRELVADQARELFNAAFVRMKPDLPQIDRNGRVLSKTGALLYRYAKYEDLDLIITPILEKHGFALSFTSETANNHTVVYGHLMHSAGHRQTSSFPLKPDKGQNRNDLQADGSGLSYAMRYLTFLLLNLARKGMDDDGHAFGQAPITDEHKAELERLLMETKTDVKSFLSRLVTNAETLDDIREVDFTRLLNALLDRKARQANAQGSVA